MDKKYTIEKLIREAYEKGVFNGTWLYAENGEIVSEGAIGYRDPEKKNPIEETDIFDIGSVSKQFTATAIMLLRRKGLLDLDDGVAKYFPKIPCSGITIRQLLIHTSGLPDYMAWVTQLAQKENVIPDNDVVLRFLTESGAEPLFTPGSKFEYCNTGYCLLAEIVAKVSGIPFAEFLKENIFEPAGMHSTALIHRFKDGLKIDNLPCGEVYEDGNYILAEDSQWGSLVISIDGSDGDGFVKSTISDLYRWDRALREGTVLTREEQDIMYSPGRLNNGELSRSERGYGFGWGIFEHPVLGKTVQHAGEIPGYHSYYVRMLDADRVLITLCSRTGIDAFAEEAFYSSVAMVAFDQEPDPLKFLEDHAVEETDRSGWDTLCGRYEAKGSGWIVEEVFMEDGELYAWMFETELGDRFKTRLYPLDNNSFGIKLAAVPIVFGDGFLDFGGELCKKV